MAAKDWGTSLLLKSDLMSASEIRDALGIQDAESYEKGSPVSDRPGARLHECSIWRLQSQESPQAPLAQHLNDLLSKVEGKSDAIRLLGKRCEAELWIVTEVEGHQLGFEIEQEMLVRIAGLGLTVVFDIYS